MRGLVRVSPCKPPPLQRRDFFSGDELKALLCELCALLLQAELLLCQVEFALVEALFSHPFPLDLGQSVASDKGLIEYPYRFSGPLLHLCVGALRVERPRQAQDQHEALQRLHY